MDKSTSGILLAVGTGLLWALSSPASKLLGQSGADMNTVVLLRCAVSSLVLGTCIGLFAPQHLHIRRREFLALFLLAPLAPVCAYLGFMLSVAYLPVATALVVRYTAPIATAMGSSLITGEKPGPYDLFGAIAVSLGVLCSVMRPDWSVDTEISVPGLIWGLLGVLGISAQALWGRASVTRGGVSGMGIFFYSNLFGGLWMFFFKSLTSGWSDLPELTGFQIGLIAITVFFTSLLGYYTFYASLRHIPASTVSLLTSGEVPAAIVMTSMATDSWPTRPAVLGCILILSAIVLSSRQAGRTPHVHRGAE
ncbi:DMT family transporter [Fretibacterium sp. OH1220_COT-178]|uniref:DMT family transporter n=1 Tax=Fretibacterium sp. OH1220_COT-178 TaxID=2491047 RepID=UPI000F5F0BA2|nr:DMT family transporter [Fretibacterium sp. OH1220_COT-178]RRD64191.1 DMT family transporter [Fretibacterium sp. OH1220_COT-178]